MTEPGPATEQRIIDALMAVLNDGRPMQEIMRANEVAAGYRVVLPGEEPWLSMDDWHETVTISIDGKTVRLVAILAKAPGTGALTRTVRGIVAAGLIPCIVAPTREMRATVKRWGWRPRVVGAGMDAEEQWRPSKRALLKAREDGTT